jgi:AraC-like DNA-binding protein
MVGGDVAGFSFDQTDYMQLFPGMVVMQVDFKPSESNTFSQVIINRPLIEFSFHITGHAKGSLSNSLRTYSEVQVGPATTLVSFNPEARCEIQVRGGERFRALNVYMQPHMLGDLLGEELAIMPGKLKAAASGCSATPFNVSGDLNPEMRMIVDQIMCYPHQGAIRKIYMESKALELIACRLAQFKNLPRKKCNCQRLKSSDLNKIHEAKDRLLASMDDPPSLASLARQVGTNTTKLTKGFRRVFGTTAFDILRRERIIRARQTLKEGKMNVTETAHYLGYSDSSHFIREFTRYYGTTPGTYLKAHR